MTRISPPISPVRVKAEIGWAAKRIFAISITTLQTTGLTAKYYRYPHLLGGIVLYSIGALLLLWPEWLMFG